MTAISTAEASVRFFMAFVRLKQAADDHAVEDHDEEAHHRAGQGAEGVAVDRHGHVAETQVVVFKHGDLQAQREHHEQRDAHRHERELFCFCRHVFPSCFI